MEVDTPAEIKELRVEAVIIRCGCGDPLVKHPRDLLGNMMPCPTPRAYAIGGGPDVALDDPRITCGCGAGGHEAGLLCPNPIAKNHAGTIAYRSSNPFKQFVWNMRQALKGQTS